MRSEPVLGGLSSTEKLASNLGLTQPQGSQLGCNFGSATGRQCRKMKTLFLLRHAKSSWDDPDLKDFERPLNSRGQSDIPVIAERFSSRHLSIDCIVSSPATRTKTTARLFAEAIGYSGGEIVSNPELYFAGVGMFLKAATLMDDSCESAMLVGHNPAITDFANAMTGAGIDNIPTCGLVQITLDIDSWGEAALETGKLVEFDFPKRNLDP